MANARLIRLKGPKIVIVQKTTPDRRRKKRACGTTARGRSRLRTKTCRSTGRPGRGKRRPGVPPTTVPTERLSNASIPSRLPHRNGHTKINQNNPIDYAAPVDLSKNPAAYPRARRKRSNFRAPFPNSIVSSALCHRNV